MIAVLVVLLGLVVAGLELLVLTWVWADLVVPLTGWPNLTFCAGWIAACLLLQLVRR